MKFAFHDQEKILDLSFIILDESIIMHIKDFYFYSFIGAGVSMSMSIL